MSGTAVTLLLELARAIKDAGYEGRVSIQPDSASTMTWTSESYVERPAE